MIQDVIDDEADAPSSDAALPVEASSPAAPNSSQSSSYQIQQGVESYKYSLLGQYLLEMGQKAHSGSQSSTIPKGYRDMVNKMLEIKDITERESLPSACIRSSKSYNFTTGHLLTPESVISMKRGILKEGERNSDADEESGEEETIVDTSDQEGGEEEDG